MQLIRAESTKKKRLALQRQSFLGRNSERLLQLVRVGVVGLGGGGSHVVQQLAHLGVSNFFLFDPDRVEVSNLNRLVGATLLDAQHARKKVFIAERYIKSVNPGADVKSFYSMWQKTGSHLRKVDVLFGCVDTYLARQELEATARRYFIPYIDIGMDVSQSAGQPYLSGQVILSLPGQSCMKCVGFLSDKKLATEAAQYGHAGERPQVVWANGVLASSGVEKFVELLTGWSGSNLSCSYRAYDGNSGQLFPHPRLRYSNPVCSHYPIASAGDPMFD